LFVKESTVREKNEMRRPILNTAVLVIVLTLTLSSVAVLPVTSQDKEEIKSKLEDLRLMVEKEHPCLENKVNAVIHQIEAGAFNGALNKMINDVNKTITMWVEDPTDLYELVNEIVDLIQGITPPSPDFQITAYPDELEIEQNSSGTSTIKVKSFHGFKQRVDLSAKLTPSTDKIDLDLDPTWVIPTPNGNTSTLTIEVDIDAEAQEYVITVSGTNGTLTRSVDIELIVEPLPTPPIKKDFTIQASPTSLVVQQGGSNISIITVTSVIGFSKTVDLEVTSPPILGIDSSLDPSQVFLLPNKSAISKLAIDVASTAAIGTYTITVNGTSGLLHHSVDILVEVKAPSVPPVPDFSVIASPTSLTIQQGDTSTSTIIVASLKGFSKPVVLTITSGSISGIKLTLEPSTVTPQANSLATATLTVEVGTATMLGEYVITVEGTSDTLKHPVNISLKVVVEKISPVIVSVMRQPEKPSYNETVTMLASVTDAGSGVKDVILSYSRGTKWENKTMTLKEGLYRTTVPAFPFNTMVNYCVYASDKVGNKATPTSVYSYVVADPYPPVIGEPSWSPEEPAANEEITINVTVTEPVDGSGVEEVVLWYSNKTLEEEWQSTPMTLNGGNWTAKIANQSDTVVTFFIEAFDKAENRAESEEQEFTVAAPAGFPLGWVLAAIAAVGAGIGGVVYYWRRRRKKTHGTLALTTPTPT